MPFHGLRRAAGLGLGGLGLGVAAAAGLWAWGLRDAQAPAPAIRIVTPIPAEASLLAWAEAETALPRRAPGLPAVRILTPDPGPEAPAFGLASDLPLLALRPAPPAAPAPQVALAAPPARPEAPAAVAARLDSRLPLVALTGAEPEPVPERGLRRSPLPQARPARILALAAAPAPAPETQVAARLPAPPARPAAVARLAALPPSAAPLAPRAEAPAIQVPPLTETASAACAPQLARAIPRRPAGAAGGRAAMAALAGAGGTQRDAAIVRAAEAGNIPDHLRALVPVTLTGTGGDGRRAQITLCVMPDYLAVGSDRDFVRVPLGLPAANRLAQRFEMMLPTARMVDAIHAQARVRLRPSPMTPGAQMASTDYFLRHNATVEAQRASAGAALGALVSGHKKDLVISNRLARVAGRVAIYGWHQANGRPIQPLSTVHGQNYADYSHGIRLISRTAYVNGRAVDLRDLLADRRFASILSGDEGPIASREILAALR